MWNLKFFGKQIYFLTLYGLYYEWWHQKTFWAEHIFFYRLTNLNLYFSQFWKCVSKILLIFFTSTFLYQVKDWDWLLNDYLEYSGWHLPPCLIYWSGGCLAKPDSAVIDSLTPTTSSLHLVRLLYNYRTTRRRKWPWLVSFSLSLRTVSYTCSGQRSDDMLLAALKRTISVVSCLRRLA